MSQRILVIEDQEDNRRIVRDLLTSVGYELIEAVNGEEHMKLLRPRAGPDPHGCRSPGLTATKPRARSKPSRS